MFERVHKDEADFASDYYKKQLRLYGSSPRNRTFNSEQDTPG